MFLFSFHARTQTKVRAKVNKKFDNDNRAMSPYYYFDAPESIILFLRTKGWPCSMLQSNPAEANSNNDAVFHTDQPKNPNIKIL